MKTKSTVLALMVCAIGLAGCAKEPTEAIEASRAAFESAKTAEAPTYAQAEYTQAEISMKKMQVELESQEKKFPLFRKYDVAVQAANEAKMAAENAVTEAEAGKAEMKSEVTDLLDQTRQALTELQVTIAAAPQGKDSAADLKMIQADVQGIETTLAQVDQSLSGGQYKDALSRAQAANRLTQEIQAELQAAMNAQAQAMPSGR